MMLRTPITNTNTHHAVRLCVCRVYDCEHVHVRACVCVCCVYDCERARVRACVCARFGSFLHALFLACFLASRFATCPAI